MGQYETYSPFQWGTSQKRSLFLFFRISFWITCVFTMEYFICAFGYYHHILTGPKHQELSITVYSLTFTIQLKMISSFMGNFSLLEMMKILKGIWIFHPIDKSYREYIVGIQLSHLMKQKQKILVHIRIWTYGTENLNSNTKLFKRNLPFVYNIFIIFILVHWVKVKIPKRVTLDKLKILYLLLLSVTP